MRKKMTSKQALEELYVDIRQFEEHFLNCICFDSEEEYNLIKKDLEMLEILKKHIYYSNKSNCIRMQDIYKKTTSFDYEELKEWLLK